VRIVYCVRVVRRKIRNMIREKDITTGLLVIDLDGPSGNAYVLLATARSFARQLGLDEQEVSEEMRSGDYEKLLEVFDDYFGHFVILERKSLT
jgi:hypothetical protein